MNWILLLLGLVLWCAAGMIVSNEYNARRNSITPTIVLGNSFAATINIFVGIVLIGLSFA